MKVAKSKAKAIKFEDVLYLVGSFGLSIGFYIALMMYNDSYLK